MAKKQKVVEDGQKRDKRGTPYYDVADPKTGRKICRVASYTNALVDETDGIQRLLDYIPVFTRELEKGKWGGFIFDSVSFAALNARKMHQYVLNPDTTNQLQWYGGATDIIEEVLCCQLPAFACHVGVSFHVHVRKVEDSESKSKSMRQPFVPGRRLEETKMVGAAWPELYRLFTRKVDDKNRRFLQSESSASYQAGTCIGMPDNVRVPKRLPPDFIWQGYAGKGMKPEIHLGVYSDPHVGKSTFLAQLFMQLCPDRPFYVAMFDARGKDVAYRLLGEVPDDAAAA